MTVEKEMENEWQIWAMFDSRLQELEIYGEISSNRIVNSNTNSLCTIYSHVFIYHSKLEIKENKDGFLTDKKQ